LDAAAHVTRNSQSETHLVDLLLVFFDLALEFSLLFLEDGFCIPEPLLPSDPFLGLKLFLKCFTFQNTLRPDELQYSQML